MFEYMYQYIECIYKSQLDLASSFKGFRRCYQHCDPHTWTPADTSPGDPSGSLSSDQYDSIAYVCTSVFGVTKMTLWFTALWIILFRWSRCIEVPLRAPLSTIGGRVTAFQFSMISMLSTLVSTEPETHTESSALILYGSTLRLKHDESITEFVSKYLKHRSPV